ncbi:hypothetical protein Sta7437_1321 [Stanieria cyanosphaera PCC 7437]|uniref:Uncharacterized protein n=1 Tax=Stanieria cyanosphaera (strain ATCC 29371 / PCC 7437) TaxID=111780 RepID=K9XQT5_STAC7|nr:hypothetical protein Sta7437_1321 [Stanieria cyanosphaera PCC 7437]
MQMNLAFGETAFLELNFVKLKFINQVAYNTFLLPFYQGFTGFY